MGSYLMSDTSHSLGSGLFAFGRHCRYEFLRQGRDGPLGDIGVDLRRHAKAARR